MRAIPPPVPYLWTGGIVMKVRVAGKYENVSLLVAIGVNPEGHREVLGIAPGFQEDKGSWLSFLRRLKEKGLPIRGPRRIRRPPGDQGGALGVFSSGRMAALDRTLLPQHSLLLPEKAT